MANKVDDKIILALLHDTTGDPVHMAGSTGAITEANAADGKFTRDNAKEAAADSVLDQSGNPLQKIFFTLGAHPEIAENIAEDFGEDITPILLSGDLGRIRQLLFNYLKHKNANIEDVTISEFGEGGQFESKLKQIPVKVGDKTYKLLVAETEEEKERGLMDVEEMDSDEGMLFDYSDNPQEEISF